MADKDIDYHLIGSRIHDARKKKKMTQEQLAEKLGLSVPFISRVECGNTKVSLRRITQISKLLDITEGELLNGTSYNSSDYLNSDFSILLKNCPSDKLKLIYDIAKIIVEN